VTGPVYPKINASSAIGQFQIGISPIGVVETFDVWTTIIAQYANSPILVSWIESFNDAMDLSGPMTSFYDMIWNVLTAQGYGLDVWGRIVGVERAIQIPGVVTLFGFNEAGTSWTGFDQGGFYSGENINQNYVLTDANFRTLILAKAAGNISDGSIPSVNQILMTLFKGRGDCYVADGLDMTLTYTFTFPLTPVELAIVSQLNVLPNPAGVVINIQQA